MAIRQFFRCKERSILFFICVVSLFCLLVTLHLYKQQVRYYKDKLMSIDSLFENVADLSEVDIEALERNLTFVTKGGLYKPVNCTCNHHKKVAIIVPFRERHQHLGIFLKHIHPFLRKQNIYYRIFVIEQANTKRFNRGKLMNIGFQEAIKADTFNCIVFHDVDLLPLSGGNEYFCPTSPRHMSVSVDTMDFRKPYEDIFGGVSAIFPEHFKTVNGYPNRYWGWGGEDDDLSERLKAAGYRISTAGVVNGMYKMLGHSHSVSEEFHDRYKSVRKWHENKDKDGLNTLEYNVLKREEKKLHTLISCDI